jgi:hypothetical protein
LQKKSAPGSVFFAALLGFLKGVLGKVGVWAWFLDGKNVVNAWWNVVS